MSRLRQLISEVHRRSLWQVLLVYLGAAYAILEATDLFIDRIGLPDWVFQGAFVLLVVGFPVVMLTALVQAGGPVRTRRDPTLLPGDEGGGPASSFARLRGPFTWRNAITGGALAFGLWGVGATGWLLFYGGAGSGVMKSSSVEWVESIAVLPFADMSPEGDQEYFSDGMSEELIDALAKVPGLRVAARTSSFQFKGQNPDVRDVAEKLGVDAVLEGSVRQSDGRVRITASW